MRYRSIFATLVISLLFFPACSDNTNKEKAVVSFLTKYRQVKSSEQVLSGEKYNEKLRKMWTPDFSSFDSSNSERTYLILEDKYQVIKSEYLGKKTYDTKKNLKGDSFFIDIEETIVAKYQDGKIVKNDNRVYSVTYWIIITETGPRIQGDSMMSSYAILRSDKNKLPFNTQDLN